MEFMGQSEVRDQTFDFEFSFRTLRVQEIHQRWELLSFTYLLTFQTFLLTAFHFFSPKTNSVKVCEGFNGILIHLPCLWSRSQCRGSESARVGPDPQLDLTQLDYVGAER